MDPLTMVVVVVFVVFIGVTLVITIMRNNKIRRNGIEAEAVVSRIEEYVTPDSDGCANINYRYFVTYKTRDGRTVEARLVKIMHKRYSEGEKLNIMYMPDKTDYAVPAK